MKTVTNKTRKPIRLRLPAGKVLFLGITQRAQLPEDTLEHPPVKKLIEAGDIEVLDGLGGQAGPAGSEGTVRKGGQWQRATRKAQAGDR